MNCYYSNLIEGHNTTPREIEAALQGRLDSAPERRDLQLEARAHIRVQRDIDRQHAAGTLPDPASVDFIRWLHREFYKDAPEAMLTVRSGTRVLRMTPGEFRSDPAEEVTVGRHQPPSPAAVATFMAHFEQRYRLASLGAGSRILAIAAAHHRLNYIHPFLDGNGRVSRLMSHAMALHAGIGAHGLWSVSRGLARGLDSRGDYKRMISILLLASLTDKNPCVSRHSSRSSSVYRDFFMFQLLTRRLSRTGKLSLKLDEKTGGTSTRFCLRSGHPRIGQGDAAAPKAAEVPRGDQRRPPGPRDGGDLGVGGRDRLAGRAAGRGEAAIGRGGRAIKGKHPPGQPLPQQAGHGADQQVTPATALQQGQAIGQLGFADSRGAQLGPPLARDPARDGRVRLRAGQFGQHVRVEHNHRPRLGLAGLAFGSTDPAGRTPTSDEARLGDGAGLASSPKPGGSRAGSRGGISSSTPPNGAKRPRAKAARSVGSSSGAARAASRMARASASMERALWAARTRRRALRSGARPRMVTAPRGAGADR
jgi:hypothetical protein